MTQNNFQSGHRQYNVKLNKARMGKELVLVKPVGFWAQWMMVFKPLKKATLFSHSFILGCMCSRCKPCYQRRRTLSDFAAALCPPRAYFLCNIHANGMLYVPREVLQSPFSEVIKKYPDRVWGSWLWVALLEQGGCTRRPPELPSNLRHAGICLISIKNLSPRAVNL